MNLYKFISHYTAVAYDFKTPTQDALNAEVRKKSKKDEDDDELDDDDLPGM